MSPFDPIESDPPLLPVPVGFACGVMRADSESLVCIRIATPMGVSAYVVSPEDAQAYGEQLVATSRKAQTGLVTPVSRLVIPNG